MNDRSNGFRSRRSTSGLSRVSVMIGIVVLLFIGVVAGVRWHAPLAGLFGFDRTSSAPPAQSDAQKQLWTCGMHPQVIRDHPGDCPICHMKLTPLASSMATGSTAGGERKIKYWWDPMLNAPYISDHPGKSPMGMDLVPVYADEVSGGAAVSIDPVVVQNMGVRVARVIEAPLARTIRAVAYLEEPEPGRIDVNLRVGGWIQTLYADTEGMPIEQGDPLFDLYSPELQVAIEELIAARKSRGDTAPTTSGSPSMAETLYAAIQQKLVLLGIDAADVDALAKLEHAPPTVTFKSPISGHLMEKQVFAGAAVKAGDLVMRLSDRSKMWFEMRVFEVDLPFIHVGMPVHITLESMPGHELQGEVSFLHPHLDPTTRTDLVRVVLPNPMHALRQGMYATGEMTVQISARALVVPRDAVIDTGTRQIAFVALERGHFEPRKVVLGQSGSNGLVQVLSGLARGETVVTSGQFLLDAESRIRAAVQKHLDEGLLEAGAPENTPARSEPARAPTIQSPAPPLSVDEAPQERIDAVFAAYLALARELGAPQATDTPADASALISASKQLVDGSTGTTKTLANAVSQALTPLAENSLEAQRESLKLVGMALVALADRRPPSRAVAEQLYVLHCPMAPGDWLQTTPEVANPFYARSMKSCGEIVRTIATRSER